MEIILVFKEMCKNTIQNRVELYFTDAESCSAQAAAPINFI